MPRPLILASFRSADQSRWEEELRALESAGIDGLHIDVMDGEFVEESCFDPEFVRKLRASTELMLDVHLIARRPEALIDDYAAAGANRIAFHWEATEDAPGCVRQIREAGAEPGIVILPGSPLDNLRELLPLLALVNPLGVDPTQGLGYQDSTPQRVATLCKWRKELGADYVVQADGGVWEKTRDELVEAGADELVGGYPIFSKDDYRDGIAALRG